jgi:hypothetical protein
MAQHTSNPKRAGDAHALLRDLASLTAEIIRRIGASYGAPADWRHERQQSANWKSAESRNTRLPLALCGGGNEARTNRR